MKTWFKFKKEANLLDSKLYIIKTFLAVITAYFLAIHNSVLKLDTISVLFGLMLTLEPVTLTGLKSGFNQIYASILGAISTAIIIYFLSVNVWSIGIALAFTVFVCLKINWRDVSPFAIFTSIYMTQFIQKSADGSLSIFLTFKLRMLALGFGILVAIIYNFIFSRISYRSMFNKRILFLLQSMINNLKHTVIGIREEDKTKIQEIKNNLPETFKNIDWVFSLFEDMKKELKFLPKTIGFLKEDVEKLQNIILIIRNITHLNYDLSYVILKEDFKFEEFSDYKNKSIQNCEMILVQMLEVKEIFINKSNESTKNINFKEKNIDNDNIDNEIENTTKTNKSCYEELIDRILHNLNEMNHSIHNIKKETKDIEFFKKK